MNTKLFTAAALALMAGAFSANAQDRDMRERATDMNPPMVDTQTTGSIYSRPGDLPGEAETRKQFCQNSVSQRDTDCIVFRAQNGD